MYGILSDILDITILHVNPFQKHHQGLSQDFEKGGGGGGGK